MIRHAMAMAIGVAIATTAIQADGRSSHRDPWTYAHRSSAHRSSPHPSASHRSASTAAFYKRECKAKCRSDYEINVSFCSSEPRGQKGECRHLESLTRKDCLAHCI